MRKLYHCNDGDVCVQLTGNIYIRTNGASTNSRYIFFEEYETNPNEGSFTKRSTLSAFENHQLGLGSEDYNYDQARYGFDFMYAIYEALTSIAPVSDVRKVLNAELNELLDNNYASTSQAMSVNELLFGGEQHG